MSQQELIPIDALCSHYHVDVAFIDALSDFGLIELEVTSHAYYVHQSTLPHVEKLLRMHRDLELSAEALDVVCNLLEKMETLQRELYQTRSRLRLYEV